MSSSFEFTFLVCRDQVIYSQQIALTIAIREARQDEWVASKYMGFDG